MPRDRKSRQDAEGSVDSQSRIQSEYRGVCWNKKNRRWQAAINAGGKYIYLGSFGNEIEAAIAFDREAIKQRGSKAKLNFPDKRALYKAELEIGKQGGRPMDDKHNPLFGGQAPIPQLGTNFLMDDMIKFDNKLGQGQLDYHQYVDIVNQRPNIRPDSLLCQDQLCLQAITSSQNYMGSQMHQTFQPTMAMSFGTMGQNCNAQYQPIQTTDPIDEGFGCLSQNNNYDMSRFGESQFEEFDETLQPNQCHSTTVEDLVVPDMQMPYMVQNELGIGENKDQKGSTMPDQLSEVQTPATSDANVLSWGNGDNFARMNMTKSPARKADNKVLDFFPEYGVSGSVNLDIQTQTWSAKITENGHSYSLQKVFRSREEALQSVRTALAQHIQKLDQEQSDPSDRFYPGPDDTKGLSPQKFATFPM